MSGVRPYPPDRRAAAEALLGEAGLTRAEIARRTGIPYGTVTRWARELSAGRRAGTRRGPAASADLTGCLRAHIGRQIAAFDASLNRPGATLDSARVLRDLGGLKRLIDEIDEKRTISEGAADAESPHDLAALRARIAQRCAALEDDGADAAPPAKPAA